MVSSDFQQAKKCPHCVAAVAFLDQGQAHDALYEFDQALKVETDHLGAYLGRAEALCLLDDHESAISAIDQILTRQPSHLPARTKRAELLRLLSRHEEAMALVEEILAESPYRFDALHIKGNIFTKIGCFREAIPVFKRLRELRPARFEGWYGLAGALRSIGDNDDALANAHWAYKLGPRSNKICNELAQCLIELRRLNDAEAAYKESLEIDPEYSITHALIGQLHLRRNRPSDALRSAKDAIRFGPSSAIAWLTAGNAYSALEDYFTARPAYEEAIRIDGSVALHWNGLGNALLKLDAESDALSAFETGISLNPLLTMPWVGKTVALLKGAAPLNERETPARCLNKAVQLERNPRVAQTPGMDLRIRHILSNNIDAPLLAHWIATKTPAHCLAENGVDWLSLIVKKTRCAHSMIKYIDGDDCELAIHEKALLKGRIQLIIGDAPASLKSLEESENIEELSLCGQVYYSWAMQECLEPESDIESNIRFGLKLASETLSDPSASADSLYWAGQMAWLSGSVEDARQAFDRSHQLIESKYMRWLIAHEHGSSDADAEILRDIADHEFDRAKTGVPGLLFPLGEIEVEVHDSYTRSLVELRLKQYEVSEAIGSLWAAHSLPDLGCFKALFDKLGATSERGSTFLNEEYEKRAARWVEHNTQLNEYREIRSGPGSESEMNDRRKTCDPVLRHMRLENSKKPENQSVEYCVGEWVYTHSLEFQLQVVTESIELLMLERRIALVPTLRLVSYATERAKYDREFNMELATARTALFALDIALAAFISIHGMDALVSVSTGVAGISVSENVLSRIESKMKQRRAVGKPFPRYDEFVDEFSFKE